MLFSFLLFLNLIPILLLKYFVTLDGPSHLYNANLIKHLLLNTPPYITISY